MAMVRAFSSFIAIAATALWWLDGWSPFRVQFALNPINLLRRFVGFHWLKLAKPMQKKRVAQIKTQSCRPQLADVDSGVVRWMKMNSVAHPFQPLANIDENLIRNGGFVPLPTKTLCMRHSNQLVLESGDTAILGRSERASLFPATPQF